MRFCLTVRARARPEESIGSKHGRLVQALQKLGQPWGMRPDSDLPTPDPGAELVAKKELTTHLGKGIRGYVLYQFRRHDLRDADSHDDHIALEFDAKRVDFEQLTREACWVYARAFDAYRLELGPIELLDLESKKYVNRRDKVAYVYPVAYYDALLCSRAFDSDPEELGRRLRLHCQLLSADAERLFFAASFEPLSLREAGEFDRRVRRSLRAR